MVYKVLLTDGGALFGYIVKASTKSEALYKVMRGDLDINMDYDINGGDRIYTEHASLKDLKGLIRDIIGDEVVSIKRIFKEAKYAEYVEFVK